MKKLWSLALTAGLFLSVSTVRAQAPLSPLKLDIKLVTDKLAYPTAFAAPNDKSGRLFVCEQRGRVRIIKNGVLRPEPFLDITPDVLMMASADEMGLLGIAFHPNFAKNGRFYIYHSRKIPKTPGIDHRGILKEYTLADPKANTVSASTVSREVIAIDETDSNHNGGDIKFGPDGYLYMALGDGGAYNDLHGEFGNAQNMNQLLGKILRIDINRTPYGIPADNPFVGKADHRPEIWAYGMRNPWRISFDKITGKLFAGDVGQNNWEEVDIITKGGNYGWRIREGTHVKFPNDPDPKNWINPIADYGHNEGISITGGFVYRGKAIPALAGKYLFGDLNGTLWTLTDTKRSMWTREKLSISKAPGTWQIYSFGEDQQGELYILANMLEQPTGAVYKVVAGK